MQHKTEQAAEHPTTVDAAVAYLSTVEDVLELGDDAEDVGRPAVSTEPDATHEVTYTDGRKGRVPVSELIAGYLRKQDYEKQTAALTEQRTAVSRLKAQMEELQDLAGALRPEHVTQVLPPLALPDPMLAQTDPVGYGRQRAAIDAELARRQQLMQVIAQQATGRQAQARARRQAWESEQERRLAEAWPEMASESGPELLIQTRKALSTHYGFAPEELDLLTDHRLKLMARDALRWRQAEAAAKAAAPARPPAPRTAAPAGIEGANGASALLDRIGKSGSRERDMRLAAQYLLS
ncbi:MAG: hypothetical protein RIM84_26145 [Alphaproteobacteria bacterium]